MRDRSHTFLLPHHANKNRSQKTRIRRARGESARTILSCLSLVTCVSCINHEKDFRYNRVLKTSKEYARKVLATTESYFNPSYRFRPPPENVTDARETTNVEDFSIHSSSSITQSVLCERYGVASSRSINLCHHITPISEAENFENPDSHQSKAAKWIMEEDSHVERNSTLDKDEVAQRYTMGVLYFSLSDAKGISDGSNSWLTSSHECSWSGVSCSSAQKVTEIDLSNMNLTGRIPEEISELKSLQRFDLFTNKVTGSIPPSLGKLQQLQFLDLTANQIQGHIPEELFNAKSLQYLYMTGNHLSGTVSKSLGNLDSLVDLRLDYNELTGPLDEAITKLKNLRWMILRSNQMDGDLPSDFRKMRNLFYLDLSMNDFSGRIPNLVAGPKKLRFIYLDHNSLSGKIPSNLASLGSKLRAMRLNDNKLSGYVPEQFYKFIQANELHVQNNRLSYVPWGVCSLNVLEGREVVSFEADCKICDCERPFCSSCRRK